MRHRRVQKHQERRALFVPPKPGKQRHRSAITWPPPDWRSRVPPALTRALVAVGFAAIPSFESRFGAATLPLVCIALAVFAGLVAYFVFKSEASGTWPLTATDSAILLLLVPTIAVASGIEVADIQLGGQAANFLAAAAAVLGVTAIAALVAVVASIGRPAAAALAVMPAPLLVAAAIGGAERFAADALPQGFSAAWMIAAIATLTDGLLPFRLRSLVPITAFAILAVGATGLGRSTSTASVTDANAAIAFATTAAAGLSLLVVPAAATRATVFVTEPLPQPLESTVERRG